LKWKVKFSGGQKAQKTQGVAKGKLDRDAETGAGKLTRRRIARLDEASLHRD